MHNHPKLTHVPRVIHDILDIVGRPQGSYWVRYRLNKKIDDSDHGNPPKTYPNTQGHP